jgi:hypothetical protein
MRGMPEFFFGGSEAEGELGPPAAICGCTRNGAAIAACGAPASGRQARSRTPAG